jgi:uncharacterized protein (TIGR03790 family)
MAFRSFLAGTLSIMAMVAALRGAEPGESVVVIYNTRLPDSKSVADHYALRRHVPASQMIGVDLPAGETMSRAEYREQLQEPLLKFLEENKLFVYPSAKDSGEKQDVSPIAAKVRYAVLCYGVPLRIAEDPSLVEPGAEKLAEPLRRNGAAVDSELCTLPVKNSSVPRAGPQPNLLYGKARALLDPTNGLLMVARVDGPSAAIARALVDKAMTAEIDGLWGRAYFDLRGLTNGGLKTGDDWIRDAAGITHRFGFETVVDEKPETFPASFPMSQIALYAGWYDGTVSGPFTRPNVEFMPGAFAYHLHSFSAQTLRTTNQNWCGPLLADGVTATMGCIDEPFLDGTPKIDAFFAAWLPGGYTFGEAAYACQRFVSWQTTVVGDPLYQPFGKAPRVQHEALERRHSKLLEWADLRYVNEGLVLGAKPAEMLEYLQNPDVPKDSAVLAEKTADLYRMEGEDELSIKSLRRALQLDPSPQQEVRLTLTLADRLVNAGKETEALALCDNFLKKRRDYPDAVSLYRKMEATATRLHQTKQAKHYAQEIDKLTGGKGETPVLHSELGP